MISAEEIKALMAKDENGLLALCCKNSIPYVHETLGGRYFHVQCGACEAVTANYEREESAVKGWNESMVGAEIISTLQTLLNQAAEALEKLGGSEAFTVSFMADKNKEWDECVARMKYAEKALAAIEPYLTKEGE